MDIADLYIRSDAWNQIWDSNRLSRIIRRAGLKCMNAAIGISLWQNIVEAISNRYIKHPFEFEEDAEDR